LFAASTSFTDCPTSALSPTRQRTAAPLLEQQGVENIFRGGGCYYYQEDKERDLDQETKGKDLEEEDDDNGDIIVLSNINRTPTHATVHAVTTVLGVTVTKPWTSRPPHPKQIVTTSATRHTRRNATKGTTITTTWKM
jgi:hypothetical protein